MLNREGGGKGLRRALETATAAALLAAVPAGIGGGADSPAGAVDPLQEFLERAPGDGGNPEEILTLVEDAADALADDRPLDAVAIYDSVAARAPTLQDWIPVLKAEAAAEAGDLDAVTAFLEEVPQGADLRQRWEWRFAVRAREAADDTVGAAEEAGRRAGALSRDEERAQAHQRSARLFLEAADTARAREAAWGALDASRDSGPARSAAQILHELPDAALEEEWELARVLLDQRDWRRAWERLEDTAPEGDDEAWPERMRADLGRGLVELGDHADALEVLGPLDADATPEGIRADALYWKGRAHLEEGRDSRGHDLLARAARLDPDHRAAGRAHLRLAQEAAEDDEPARAAEHLTALAAGGHRTASSDLLAVRLASRSYLEGAYGDGHEFLSEYAMDTAGTVADKVRHWQALLLEAAGRETEARTILQDIHDRNPFGFQGVAAAHRLDRPLLESGVASGPEEEGSLNREIANALLRLQVHQRVPTPGSFQFELDRLEEHFLTLGGDAPYQLAEALIDEGLTVQGILLGREIRREEGEWNLRLLRIVYPFPHREEVVTLAHERNLDPFLVAGLIRQESMFRADIRSPAGAVGLMQLMPATARGVAQQVGLGGSLPTSRLEDPRLNLRLGTHFLRQMLDRFDGSVTDALAAYNAGPTNARRWRNFEEHSDVRVFVTHIPFRETRHYVRIVQQNARIYAALYGCGEFQACPGLSYAQWVEQTQPLVRPPTAIPAR